METNIRPIQIQDSFKKRWSEAATIISEEDLKQAESNEKTDNIDGEAKRTQNDVNGNIQIIPGINTKMPDIRIHSDFRVSTSQHCVRSSAHSPVTFRTPQKLPSDYSSHSKCFHSGPQTSFSDSCLTEKADWMLAERSNSRSPSSPAEVTSRSPSVRMSPVLQSSSTVFNFSPERTELYREQNELESRRVKKRLFDEMTSGSQKDAHTSGFTVPVTLPSTLHHHGDGYLSPRRPVSPRQHTSRDHTSRDLIRLPHDIDLQSRGTHEPEVTFYLNSPTMRSKVSNLFSDTEQFRAKRRIDVDQEYVSTPKRVKIDLEREMGFRYIQQLDSDIENLRTKLRGQEAEVKPNCSCAIMERQFLEMAESAYRSVRRIDASPRGFEQFRRELIQTNEVMKDSMEVLKNIRRFCEH